MKTKLALALIALVAMGLNPLLRAETAAAALPAPLPELMNDEQAAKWSAAQEAATTTASASEPSTQFYTGKPYVADAGGYIYKYRTYNPEMSRWTSADPSGFPDGANNFVYVHNNGVCFFDNNGLVTFSGLTAANLSSTTASGGNGITYTITALPLVETSLSSSSINISVNTYTVESQGAGYGGATFALSLSNLPTTYTTTYNFTQYYTINSGSPNSDNGSNGYYYANPSTTFYDEPNQSLSQANPTFTGTLTTTLYAVSLVPGQAPIALATLQWGFKFTE